MSTIAPRRIKLLPILAWGYVAWSLVPVLIAVAYSFNDGRSRTMWQGFSFRWWFGDPNASVFRDESMRQAIINSLVLATATMLIVAPLESIKYHSEFCLTSLATFVCSLVTMPSCFS